MDQVSLGRSGTMVSKLCLGTMMFGGRTDEAETRRIIDSAADTGVNFIDTADVYNGGASEELVGRAIASRRYDWVLATKAGNRLSELPNRGGLSRRWLIKACEDSLRRLGTESIDIYYLHLEDHGTPMEETVGALADLVRQGKIHHIGLSNFRAWRLVEMARLCDLAGIDRPLVCQPYYNAMNRMPEVEVLPACHHLGMAVVPYSPLARGILTGKYGSGDLPDPESRAGQNDMRMMQTEWRSESFDIGAKIKNAREARGLTSIGFALGWLLNNRIVTAPIAGPRTFEQWQSYLKALDEPFTAEDEALLNELVPAGHPSTPGYTDPRYPVEGRSARTTGG
ncbi:MAG: aldo/keto reductase [Geminicoccaceae bacterium]